MKPKLGYDVFVRRLLSASVALFSLLLFAVLVVSTSHAQVNGPPASVTSPGFGGNAIIGPNGYAPFQNFPFFTRFRDDERHHDGDRRRDDGRRHHHHFVPFEAPLIYAFPLPDPVDMGAADEEEEANANAEAEDQAANYQGGPTIFDRRGSGRESYVAPVKNVPPPHSAEHAEEATTPEPLEPTTLVFKDGHKLEVGNYAIIGQTLFDMTPGHVRKVPLSDLDLEATRRINDEHGVAFALPLSSSRTN